MWRWSNFLHANVEANRRTLLVNMDETNVRLHQDRGAGNLSMRAYRLKRKPRPLSRSVPRGDTRANMTHMATICNDQNVQKLLPQYFLVNARQVSHAECCELQARAPDNVKILRLPKAWVNKEVMLTWLRALSRCLAPLANTHRIILNMDVWRAHTQGHVLQRCGRYGFWPCIVPAKLTWALQPCDTHLFAQYKDRLALECQRRIVATTSGQWTWKTVVGSLCQVVHEVMEGRSWAKAFEDNGLTPHQELVSTRVRAKLGWEDNYALVGDRLPELHHLQTIFPRNAIVPIEELFSALIRRERGEPTAPWPKSPGSPVSATSPTTWYGRTRSTSALAAQAPAAGASSSSWQLPPPVHPPSAPPLHLPPFLPRAKRMSRQQSRSALSLPPEHAAP